MNFEKVRDIIVEIISCGEDEVTMETNLKEDLGIDSLDAMEIAMSVEEKLGVSIPEENLGQMEYVKDIVSYVDQQSK